MRFSVVDARVLHETIDGEVILIDLQTGAYYSLRESAAAVWHALEGGASEAELAARLAVRYSGSHEELVAGARGLVDELVAEGLVEATAAGTQSPPAPPTASTNGAPPGRVPFPAPVLEKHDDMQDLILLDPVHDVDARGWPHRAEGQRTTS